MPYFTTAQEWLTQSSLLLAARPTTTRITTKYTVPRPFKTHPRDQKKDLDENGSSTPVNEITKVRSTKTISSTIPATLTLKTYDPHSGVALKYKTNKAAEVGRLVQIMGVLGKGMAGLEMKEDSLVSAKELEKKITDTEIPKVKKTKGKKKSRK